MVKFILFGIAIFAVYKLFANDFMNKSRKEDKKQREETVRKAAAGELIKDQICGTYVSLENSITVRDGEIVHYFCSYDCRDKFLKNLELEKGGRAISGNNNTKKG